MTTGSQTTCPICGFSLTSKTDGFRSKVTHSSLMDIVVIIYKPGSFKAPMTLHRGPISIPGTRVNWTEIISRSTSLAHMKQMGSNSATLDWHKLEQTVPDPIGYCSVKWNCLADWNCETKISFSQRREDSSEEHLRWTGTSSMQCRYANHLRECRDARRNTAQPTDWPNIESKDHIW